MANTRDVCFDDLIFGWPQARSQASWFGIWIDALTLTIDASTVIGLRAGILSRGGRSADAEVFAMVSEKIAAAFSLQNKALTGGLGTTAKTMIANTVEHYLPEVRANRKRLVALG